MLRSKYVRNELLKLTSAQLDALCSDAQDAVDDANSTPADQTFYTSLAEACADILEDRRAIPSAWNAYYNPEDRSWSLSPNS